MAAPLPAHDLWAVDDRALADFIARVEHPPSSPTWAHLRRDAERLALVPGFDRLITCRGCTVVGHGVLRRESEPTRPM